MHSFMDSKLMAKLLRQGLAERNIELTHSDCLELVARQFGLANWNILSARIEATALELAPLRMPEGWANGSLQQDGYFRIGLDPDHTGSAIIVSTPLADHALQDQFGTMSQSIAAEPYLGGGVRVSCQLSAEQIDGAGTMWLRVDGLRGTGLRFSNLLDIKDVPLEGTRDWTDFAITLDVPEEAVSIHYGFLLRGRGLLRARNFDVSAVAASNEPTRSRTYRHQLPVNLDFSAN